jgi:hypothetical protein
MGIPLTWINFLKPMILILFMIFQAFRGISTGLPENWNGVSCPGVPSPNEKNHLRSRAVDFYCEECRETASEEFVVLEQGYAYCPECGSFLGQAGWKELLTAERNPPNVADSEKILP